MSSNKTPEARYTDMFSFTEEQQQELDRLWRIKWKRGRKPNSYWKMFVALSKAGLIVPACGLFSNRAVPVDLGPISDWQREMCTASFDPDFREQTLKTRRDNFKAASSAAGVKSVANKRGVNEQIVLDYKKAHGLGSSKIKPPARLVADWKQRLSGLSEGEKRNLQRRLRHSGFAA